MKNTVRVALLSAALLLGTSIVSLQAAGVSVGGVSVSTGGSGSGGTSANVGTSAGVSGTATVGGGSGNVANGHFDANGNVIDLNIGNTSGPLATVDQNGNPVNGTSTSAAAINLGDLLEGIDVGGGGLAAGGGVAGGGGVKSVVAGLSSGDRKVLKVRCRDVLAAPASFKIDVVRFCRMVVSM